MIARVLIIAMICMPLCSCLATPRFFPKTYEIEEEKPIKTQKVKPLDEGV